MSNFMCAYKCDIVLIRFLLIKEKERGPCLETGIRTHISYN